MSLEAGNKIGNDSCIEFLSLADYMFQRCPWQNIHALLLCGPATPPIKRRSLMSPPKSWIWSGFSDLFVRNTMWQTSYRLITESCSEASRLQPQSPGMLTLRMDAPCWMLPLRPSCYMPHTSTSAFCDASQASHPTEDQRERGSHFHSGSSDPTQPSQPGLRHPLTVPLLFSFHFCTHRVQELNKSDGRFTPLRGFFGGIVICA